MNNPTTNDSVISNFYFWCQKVLPLVYDGTLSYYEVLCQMADKLNEVIKSQNDLNEAFMALKNWIDTQLETYTKEQLEQWLDDGTLNKLIKELFMYWNLYQPYVNNQGSSYVLQNTSETIIIDFMSASATSDLINYYKAQGITSFTHAIITHFHQDHYGDIQQFLNNFDFTKCTFHIPTSPNWSLFTEGQSRQQDETNVINLLKANNINYVFETDGNMVNFANNSYLSFHNCSEGKYSPYYTNLLDGATIYNDFSMIVKFYNSENIVMFTGDLQEKGMSNNLNIISDVNILQMPHHGIQYYYASTLPVSRQVYYKGWLNSMPLQLLMTQNYLGGWNNSLNNIARTVGYMYSLVTGIPYMISNINGNTKITLNGSNFKLDTQQATSLFNPSLYPNIYTEFMNVNNKYQGLNYNTYDNLQCSNTIQNPSLIFDLNDDFYIQPNTYIITSDRVPSLLNAPLLIPTSYTIYCTVKYWAETRFTQTLHQSTPYGDLYFSREVFINSNGRTYYPWRMANSTFGLITIPTGYDLDNLKQEGNYQILNNSNLVNAPNYSSFIGTNSGSTLSVYEQNNQNRFRQEINLVSVTGVKFVRYYNTTNAWTPWSIVTNLYLSSGLPTGTQIPKGTLQFNETTNELSFFNGTKWSILATK